MRWVLAVSLLGAAVWCGGGGEAAAQGAGSGGAGAAGGTEASAAQEAPTTRTAETLFNIKIAPLTFTPPTVQHAELANGITLDYLPEREVPMVNLSLRLRAGSVDDAPGKVGQAWLTAQVMRNGGTTRLDGDALDREVDARGAQLSADSDREETWVRMSVLKEDFAWALGLMHELIAAPAFPQAKLDEARQRAKVDLKQRLDVPADLSRALFPQLIYGKGNPWGWTTTERTLDALTLDDLRAFHQRLYVAGNMKLGISGDVSWDEARAAAEKTLGALPATPRPPITPPPARTIDATQVYLVPREVSQNVVYLGHEGIERFSPEKFPIKVFNGVLSGGFASRLFKEVRSNRGLAYAVGGRMSEGTARGVYSNVALTKVASAGEALDVMLQINRDLRQAPPTAAEVKLAKDAEVNGFVFFFDTPDKIVDQKITLDGFGYPPDYLDTYVANLQKVTAEQVQDAAEKHLHPDRVVILITGTVGPELRAQLEKLGPITEINDAELRQEWL